MKKARVDLANFYRYQYSTNASQPETLHCEAPQMAQRAPEKLWNVARAPKRSLWPYNSFAYGFRLFPLNSARFIHARAFV